MTWNAAGMGNFRKERKFLYEHDLIILQETWVTKERMEATIRSLDKEFIWKAKAAIKNKRKGRASGGVMVGIRKNLKRGVTIKEWRCGLVVKNLEIMQGRKCRIIAVYNNVGFQKIEKELRDLIEEGRDEGEGVLVVGDFNVRVGEDRDGEEYPEPRNSEDKTLNPGGKRLINLCKETGCVIKNGRTEGDRREEITHVGEGGDQCWIW